MISLKILKLLRLHRRGRIVELYNFLYCVIVLMCVCERERERETERERERERERDYYLEICVYSQQFFGYMWSGQKM